MIIKSLSRKARGASQGKGRGRSPFSALALYMNRGIDDDEGRAVLWHNFYGSEKTREDEVIKEFERNGALLQERSNGNVLYHEILSFSRGHKLGDEDLFRMVADIGQEYLNHRAPDQLGYGVIHRDTDHLHLHLMVSANRVGKPDRVRLSKKKFATTQQTIERFALERYPELAQTKIYGRERPREKLKTEVHEQAMKARTQTPSRKEALKAKLHQLFETAQSLDELGRLLTREGLRLYQRGNTIGVVVPEKLGVDRKHRLATLGVLAHYEATQQRLAKTQTFQAGRTSQERADMPDSKYFNKDKPLVGKAEIKELLTGELDPSNHGPIVPPTDSQTQALSDEVAALRKRVQEMEKGARQQPKQNDRPRDSGDRGDREDDDR